MFCPTQCWWQDFKDATLSEVAGWIVDEDKNLFDLWRRSAKILFMIPGADVVVDPDIVVVGDWLAGHCEFASPLNRAKRCTPPRLQNERSLEQFRQAGLLDRWKRFRGVTHYITLHNITLHYVASHHI